MIDHGVMRILKIQWQYQDQYCWLCCDAVEGPEIHTLFWVTGIDGTFKPQSYTFTAFLVRCTAFVPRSSYLSSQPSGHTERLVGDSRCEVLCTTYCHIGRNAYMAASMSGLCRYP